MLYFHILVQDMNCVAAIGVVHFSVRGFGCALFYFRKEYEKMRAKKFSAVVTAATAVVVMLTGCGGEQTNSTANSVITSNSENSTTNEIQNSDNTTNNVSGVPDFVIQAQTNGVEYPEDYEFAFYTSEEGEECAEVVRYKGDKKEIIVPNDYEGKPVRRICEAAFLDVFNRSSAARSVVLQSNMRNICMRAFAKSDIHTIVIPGNVETIETSAFMECYELENIWLGEGVKYMGEYAFAGAKTKELIIPDSVSYIGDKCFLGTSAKLIFRGEEYDSSSEEKRFASALEDTFWNSSSVTTSENTVIAGKKDVTEQIIPDGVEKIGTNAFAEQKNLNSVKLSESVTTIGRRVFYKCNNLTQIDFSENLEYIGDEAFYGCEGLSEIKIPESVKNIGACAFEHCKNVTKITLPKNIKIIEAGTFHSCFSLSEINIPEGVTEIGAGAFAACKSLVNVTIPDSVNKIAAISSRNDYAHYASFYSSPNVKVTYKGKTYSYDEINDLYKAING